MKKVLVKCARCDGTGRIPIGKRKVWRFPGSGPELDYITEYGDCPVCKGKGKHKTEVVSA